MRKITTLTFLLVSTLGWSQYDSIQVEKQKPSYDSIISNYVQRHSLNPATAGVFNRNNFQTNYQFNIYDFPVTKLFVGFDKSFGKNDGWGIGANYRKENYNNTLISNHVGINLSKDIKIKKHTTSFGLGYEFIQLSFDWDNTIFGDMIDPRQGVIYQTGHAPMSKKVSSPNFHFGVIHSYKGLKIGTSILNFIQPSLSLTKGLTWLPAQLNFNLSYSFAIGDFDIVPIYDISRIHTVTFLNLNFISIYQNKYFITGGIQINETRNYNFSGGLYLLNNFHASLTYTNTPRYLDYAHLFFLKLAYLFNINNSNS